MKTLIGILIIAALLMFGFPYFGLIAFHGGYLYAIGATLLIGVCTVIAAFGLLGFIIPAMFGSVLAMGTGHILTARLVVFGVQTAVATAALALTAWLLAGVTLVGFGSTLICGAVIGVVMAIFHD